MSRLIIDLCVVLDYDEEDVRSDEDFDILGNGETPEEYFRERLGSFIENEINNTIEFPATASIKAYPFNEAQ